MRKKQAFGSFGAKNKVIQFEMALGSGRNEAVNPERAVQQRVREFWRLLSGSGRKHDVCERTPVFEFGIERAAGEGGFSKTL